LAISTTTFSHTGFKRTLVVIRLVGLDAREPHRDVAHSALRVFDSVSINEVGYLHETPVLAVAGGSAVSLSVTSVPVDRPRPMMPYCRKLYNGKLVCIEQPTSFRTGTVFITETDSGLGD
jgi:hypothetical protein